MPDKRQQIFESFEVPDKGRILKVKNWLQKRGFLANTNKIKILEIGYSKGGLLDNLREYSNIVKYAVDINLKTTERNIKFYKFDCNYGLPDFNGVRFNIIFAGEVIEHIIDDERFLSEINELLALDGILVLTTPNLFFLVNRILFPFGKIPYFAYAPYHYHFYDKKIISSLIEKSGFKILDIRSSHILFSSRRNKYLGKIFEFFGNYFPMFGAHLIVFAKKV